MKIKVTPAVKKASAVVALESTVYSHLGLPLPERRQALERSKAAISKTGATAAVTALLDGQIYLGLTQRQEERILEGDMARKISIRDIPVALADSWELGVTTVSTAMSIAEKAGIKVMATGGIGGVHRGRAQDISADLFALSRYSLGVVSSGAKGFLDLPRTLQTLETLGVPVVGYKTNIFPAFWCEKSGLKVSARVEDAESASRIIAQLEDTGALIAVPVPEEEALENAFVEKAVSSALKEAQKAGIEGAAQTPYILKQITDAAKGKNLTANLALLENNARVAGEIAVHLSSQG